MKKVLFCLSALIAITETSFAQDVHFSQYFTSPMTLNPGLTGLTQQDFRLAANYRSQWSTINNKPYTTGTLSYDMASMRGKFENGDYLGFGALFLYDNAGTGNLQNITVGISAAYHKAFGVDKQHTLSFGVQGTLVQKTIEQTKLIFEDQIDPNTGTVIPNTKENFPNKDLTYPDFAAGLIYSGRLTEHASLFGGVSIYHITQPVETFLNSDHKIHSRYAAYVGSQMDLNDKTVLYASALFQQQASNTEAVLGGAVGFVMNPGYDKEYQKASIFYLGGWYRYGDAVIPYLGFEWSKMQIGFTYDANLSNFMPATNGNGAYEISLIFNGSVNKQESAPRYNFSCPKF